MNIIFAKLFIGWWIIHDMELPVPTADDTLMKIAIIIIIIAMALILYVIGGFPDLQVW